MGNLIKQAPKATDPNSPMAILTRGVQVMRFGLVLKPDGTYTHTTKVAKVVRFDQASTAVDVPCTFYPGMKALTQSDKVMTENWPNRMFATVTVDEPAGSPGDMWFQVWGSTSRQSYLICMAMLKAASHMESRARELSRNSEQLREEICKRGRESQDR